jgi:hypothetical protein
MMSNFVMEQSKLIDILKNLEMATSKDNVNYDNIVFTNTGTYSYSGEVVCFYSKNVLPINFECMVNAEKFISIAKTLKKGEDVDISLKNETLHVKSGDISAKLKTDALYEVRDLSELLNGEFIALNEDFMPRLKIATEMSSELKDKLLLNAVHLKNNEIRALDLTKAAFCFLNKSYFNTDIVVFNKGLKSLFKSTFTPTHIGFNGTFLLFSDENKDIIIGLRVYSGKDYPIETLNNVFDKLQGNFPKISFPENYAAILNKIKVLNKHRQTVKLIFTGKNLICRNSDYVNILESNIEHVSDFVGEINISADNLSFILSFAHDFYVDLSGFQVYTKNDDYVFILKLQRDIEKLSEA